jgi:hypothetical protein
MKKTALAVLLVIFVYLVAGISVVSLVKANPVGLHSIEVYEDDPPSIHIDSPLSKTYNYNGNVLFNFTLSPSENWSPHYEIVDTVDYSVDGEFAKTIIANSNLFEFYPHRQNGKEGLANPFNYSIFLENLTDGNHVLRMSVFYTGYFYRQFWTDVTEDHPGRIISTKVSFTLDTVSPAIKILSVEDRTYYESDLQLNFVVSEDFCNASYVLDGENVPVAGNLTLSDLPVGNHSLIVYAYDMAGNIGASNTIAFAVEPFPTSLVVASSVTVAVVGIGLGLLLYGIKRK